MTKAEARAWRRRWKLVNEFQREELRRTPIEVKFRQLAYLMEFARQFPPTKKELRERAEVRERWSRLRKAYGV